MNNLGYLIGHEPNIEWAGDEQSLFEYYAVTARAAKAVDSSILVGGLGPWSFSSSRPPCNHSGFSAAAKTLCQHEDWTDPDAGPLLDQFTNYVVANNLPLDFLNWHSLGVAPLWLEAELAGVKQRLAAKDLGNVKLFPSDWTYWEGPYPSGYLDTAETASYIPSALAHMWLAGVDWHGHDFDVRCDARG